jgi:hypothetical protein
MGPEKERQLLLREYLDVVVFIFKVVMKTTTSRYTKTFLSRSAVLEASGSPASGQGACAEAD